VRGPGSAEGRRRAVFLDRDGTLIREADYLSDPEGVELLPGVPEALRALRDAGYALVIVTNQSGIARGLYGADDYRRVAARLDEVLERVGASVDATYHCPHHPDFSGSCDCRKPGLGMYREAAEALRLDLARSWYVGDKATDVLPAAETGGRGLLVRTGYGRATEEAGGLPANVVVVDDLRAAAASILGSDGSVAPAAVR
jgi:D-glycero-D-manno-heptose 1,7-bisphosphate phosphatase